MQKTKTKRRKTVSLGKRLAQKRWKNTTPKQRRDATAAARAARWPEAINRTAKATVRIRIRRRRLRLRPAARRS